MTLLKAVNTTLMTAGIQNMNDPIDNKQTAVFSIVPNKDGWHNVEVNGENTRVPMGWHVASVNQKTKCLDSKRKPITENDRKLGTTPYWGANGVVDYVDGYLLEGTHVLLGEDAAPFFDKTKKVAFVTEGKIWPNNHIHVLTANESPKYLEAVLNMFDYSLVLNTEIRPKLTKSAMMEMEMVFPPLPEQTRIAAVLTAQEDQIADLRAWSTLERSRLAWLTDELLSGRIRVIDRVNGTPVVVSVDEKGQATETLEPYDLVANQDGWTEVEVNGENVRVPMGWSSAGLGSIATFTNGDAHKPTDTYKVSPGLKVVRIQNLTDKDACYNYTRKEKKSLVLLHPGDIILSWSATIDVFSWAQEEAALNQHLFKVDFYGADKGYGKLAIGTILGHLRGLAHGATMKHVRKGEVEKTQVLLPPLPEQTRIAGVLTAQENQIADIEALITAEQQRLAWLTDELLSGRIRVEEQA